MILRNPTDGRVHFSDLKHMASSPAHYRNAILQPKPPTLAMQRGLAIDRVLFGGTLRVWPRSREVKAWECVVAMAGARDIAIFKGEKRAGKAWDAFRIEHEPTGAHLATEAEYREAEECTMGEPCEVSSIVTTEDYESAKRAAEAVMTDPVVKAEALLFGDSQVCISWDMHGLSFSSGIPGVRGGLDVLGPKRIVDLKATTCTEPEVWMCQAERMKYQAQLACYEEAAASIGKRPVDHWLIGVEFKAPFSVTCLCATETMMSEGRSLVESWCTLLRACEQTDNWPGYVQAPVTWEPRAERHGYGQERGDDE